MAATEPPPGAERFIPDGAHSLDDLKRAAPGCRGCELYADATQVVFGRGDAKAKIVMVGEQPGDIEDQKGFPFVGPAGHLLRRAVDAAGIEVPEIYLTNAVKHFRFVQRGQRRIHQTPEQQHIVACRPWLVSEFALLRPRVVVVLGATAAKALLGPSFRVTRQRGQVLPWPDAAQNPDDFRVAPIEGGVEVPPAKLVATIHPSAVLRADDQDLAFNGLVDDLKVVAATARR
ncbi:uracil-DNA glycosylase [Asanoa ishikariensis]|uniref:Type-4 uracil-DNA glycosylase n=1 Tax=Asanoa ishikariensis TaxID=137265 RepID=A0A1H3RNW5_9ACTN|nr:UdgX family uracil-DNA binding protein [Asanoa ishikariensis]GIF66993.1 uracil-DNA glycosylase [Asanoa ishikariensis]SDZ27454.1 DNA polymerase [Asanoa ishikariensis]